MQGVILAGGLGTRLGPGAGLPKPLCEIGGRPILWHVCKLLDIQGVDDILVALGHRAQEIVQRFSAPPVPSGGVVACDASALGLAGRLSLVDTGPTADTGGRIARMRPYLHDGPFVLAWCDGLADIDVAALVEAHRRSGCLATVAAVHPPSGFGHLTLAGDRAVGFREKPILEDQWINSGFFVVQPEALAWIEGDTTSWERDTLVRFAAARQLAAYRHDGFWRCMDTIRDRERLDALWRGGAAPWKLWREAA